MKKTAGITVMRFTLCVLVPILSTCDLFNVSLVDYLREEQEKAARDGLWVYVAVTTGDDGNSGATAAEAVQTLKRALDIWAAKGSEARIMLMEDMTAASGYSEAATSSGGLIDFKGSSLLDFPRDAITSITLAGSGSGITIDNSAGNSRPVLRINNPGLTVILKNLTITGGKKGGVKIEGGALRIEDAVFIRDNTYTTVTDNGGGVYIGGGAAVTMTGGAIHDNTGYENGGGVYVVEASSYFTLRGGEIHDNGTASSGGGLGGGVCVKANGTFLMEGGSIRNNKTLKNGGGVYVDGVSSRFTLRDGEIHDNETTDSSGLGGGVGVGSNGTFLMEGGSIRRNTSGNDGGGVFISGTNAAARILNGTVGGSLAADGNKAKYGAGLYVGTDGTLELGTAGADHPYPYVQHNVSSGAAGNASTGGGVVINGSNAKLTFYHGTVSHNDGYKLGGGILVVNGLLDMRGGTVTGNKVTMPGTGPGIAVESGGKLELSEKARILDTANPVYLSAGGLVVSLRADFTGDTAAGIARVTTTGYPAGTQILDPANAARNAAYHTGFVVDGKSLDSDGKLLP